MPTCDAFEGWKSYLKLAIPSVLMLCPDWWSFEIIIIMSGWIGVNEQATMVVLFQLISMMYMVPMGF